MENTNTSIVSVNFWRSYLSYYFNTFRKLFYKSSKHSKNFLVFYGFDFFLLIGNLSIKLTNI